MSHWLKTWMKEMVVLPQDSFLRMRQNETAANICRHFAWMPLNFQFHHAFAVFAKSPSFGAMSIQLFLIHLILSKGGKGRHKQRLGFIMAMSKLAVSKLAVSKGINCCSNPPLSCLHNYIQCYENILISGHNLASEGGNSPPCKNRRASCFSSTCCIVFPGLSVCLTQWEEGAKVNFIPDWKNMFLPLKHAPPIETFI